MRNLVTRVPKSAQRFVATMVRTVFAQPSAEEVQAQLARVIELLRARWRFLRRALRSHLEPHGPLAERLRRADGRRLPGLPSRAAGAG